MSRGELGSVRSDRIIWKRRLISVDLATGLEFDALGFEILAIAAQCEGALNFALALIFNHYSQICDLAAFSLIWGQEFGYSYVVDL